MAHTITRKIRGMGFLVGAVAAIGGLTAVSEHTSSLAYADVSSSSAAHIQMSNYWLHDAPDRHNACAALKMIHMQFRGGAKGLNYGGANAVLVSKLSSTPQFKSFPQIPRILKRIIEDPNGPATNAAVQHFCAGHK